MNTNTTSRRGRYSARAAAVATIAIILGTAACGTETAVDKGEPAAPAATPKAHAAPHPPSSADSAERRARAEQQEQYRRHLSVPQRKTSQQERGYGREIHLP